MLSIIRGKEVCQVKIAEALERAAIKKAQQEQDSMLETPGVPPTSVVGALAVCSQVESCNAELDELEAVMVASLIKEKKKKVPKVVLPPRTNLRSTLARQARALNVVQQ
jgi:hypothetical protein